MSNLNNNTTQLEVLLAKVNALPDAGSGGTDTSDATATADEIFAGETAYVAGGKVTGTFTIEEELTEQNDLISQIATLVATKANPPSTDTSDATATANDILSGKTAYVKGSKITGKITTKSAATYTPSTTDQTIASGQYLSGTQTIKGDANLKSENIASGVSIFGVTGTHSGSEDLDAELTTQESLISQLSTILDGKASGGTQTATLYLAGNNGTVFNYVGPSGNLVALDSPSGSYDIPVPSIITANASLSSYFADNYMEGAVEQIFRNMNFAAYYISGSGTIYANSMDAGGAM